jgi:outer membrane protein OmpA-like peptidoglycan-associated protein
MKSDTQIDLPGAIDFKKGKAELDMTPGTQAVLTALMDVLKSNPEITKLSIEGNTDNEGEPKFDNLKLSSERSKAVLEYLVKNGVDKARLVSVGYGSTHPLVLNDTPDHMAQNRRVEFHIAEKDGKPIPRPPFVAPAGWTATAGAKGAATAPKK